MSRIKLTIAYVGTDFNGWQTQAAPLGKREQPTVQSTVNRAVEQILGERIHIHGSGRTDSGVHARAQVAHMDVPDRADRIDWQLALNTKLPYSIRIMDAGIVPASFHAQHSAIGKTYCYALWLDRRCTPPPLYPFVWDCGPLDRDRMTEAAGCLVGAHDFAALRNAGTDVETTVRTVTMVRAESLDNRTPLYVWRFEADGFLKQMVRNMIGLLVRIGQGKIPVSDVPSILEARDRRHAGVTAPARGLCLYKVWYPGEVLAGDTRVRPWWQ